MFENRRNSENQNADIDEEKPNASLVQFFIHQAQKHGDLGKAYPWVANPEIPQESNVNSNTEGIDFLNEEYIRRMRADIDREYLENGYSTKGLSNKTFHIAQQQEGYTDDLDDTM
ncbi:MAG: hypothetical protein WCK98_03155 [bacterium]